MLAGFQFVQNDFQILVTPQAADHQWQLTIEHRGYEAYGENGFTVLSDPPGVINGGIYLVENLASLFQKISAACG